MLMGCLSLHGEATSSRSTADDVEYHIANIAITYLQIAQVLAFVILYILRVALIHATHTLACSLNLDVLIT